MSSVQTRRSSRRDFVRFGGGVFAAASSGPPGWLSAKEKIPIALQLYSVREDCQRDLPRTLAAVARMGYRGVEFADYYGHSARELRKMLDSAGLKAIGTHIMIEEMMGEKLAPTIEFNLALGNPRLTVPWVSATKKIQPWYDVARNLNEIAEKLKPHGMNVGFHNHPHELVAVEGQIPLDAILDHTVRDVTMQPDLGSVRKGGADPIAYLKRYPGRARTMHVKDYSPSNDKALIGEGEMNFQEIFRLAETIGGIEWYIVEQETYPLSTAGIRGPVSQSDARHGEVRRRNRSVSNDFGSRRSFLKGSALAPAAACAARYDWPCYLPARACCSLSGSSSKRAV